jgi:hypothetical protein
MKPDAEYLKKLLAAFREAPNPTTDIDELKEKGLPHDDPKFEFHMMLLHDDGYLESESMEGGIGISNSAPWSAIPLRLTASGHQFAEGMENNQALQTMKKYFLGASISTMRDVAVAFIKTEVAKHTGQML